MAHASSKTRSIRDNSGRSTALMQAGKLLKRRAIGRDRASVAARGPGDLAHIEISPRVEAEIVGREEVARLTGILAAAPAIEQPAIRIEDAHSPPRGIGAGRDSPRPHPCAVA